MKPEEWPELRRSIAEMLSTTKMSFSHFNSKTGKIVLGFPNLQSKEAASSLLNGAAELWCYESYNHPKLLPKLTIHNVPLDFEPNHLDSMTPIQKRDLVKESLWKTIVDKNEAIKSFVQNGSTLEIVFYQKHKYSCTVAIKVSPDIRIHIRCYIKQCFHCQKFGHLSKECSTTSKDPICMYCSGRHETRLCTFKNSVAHHKCCNCDQSKDQNIAQKSNSPHAGAPSCPIAQHIMARIQGNTQLTVKLPPKNI